MVRLFSSGFQQPHKEKSIIGEAKADLCMEGASVS